MELSSPFFEAMLLKTTAPAIATNLCMTITVICILDRLPRQKSTYEIYKNNVLAKFICCSTVNNVKVCIYKDKQLHIML